MEISDSPVSEHESHGIPKNRMAAHIIKYLRYVIIKHDILVA
jgi:hypothetical protein